MGWIKIYPLFQLNLLIFDYFFLIGWIFGSFYNWLDKNWHDFTIEWIEI